MTTPAYLNKFLSVSWLIAKCVTLLLIATLLCIHGIQLFSLTTYSESEELFSSPEATLIVKLQEHTLYTTVMSSLPLSREYGITALTGVITIHSDPYPVSTETNDTIFSISTTYRR